MNPRHHGALLSSPHDQQDFVHFPLPSAATCWRTVSTMPHHYFHPGSPRSSKPSQPWACLRFAPQCLPSSTNTGADPRCQTAVTCTIERVVSHFAIQVTHVHTEPVLAQNQDDVRPPVRADPRPCSNSSDTPATSPVNNLAEDLSDSSSRRTCKSILRSADAKDPRGR